MKFCKFCGAQLEDNAVCTCEKSRAAAAQQAQQFQQQPQQPYNQYQAPSPSQRSPYAVAGTPAGESPFVKALKNVPVIFTSFWKNSNTVIEAAKNGKDVIVAGIYTFIFFIAMMFNSMFFMISLHGLHFGKTLLVALLLTVLIGGFYSLILFAFDKKFHAEVTASKAFTDAFITFAIKSIPVSIALLIGGLCSLFSWILAIIIFAVDIVYIIVSLAVSIKNSCGDAVKNPALFVLLIVLSITAAMLIIMYVGFKITLWSHSYYDEFSSYIDQFKEGISTIFSYSSLFS